MNKRLCVLFLVCCIYNQFIFSQGLEIKSYRREIPVKLHIDLNYAPFIPLNQYKEQYNGEFYFPENFDSAVWINKLESIKLSTLYPILSFGIKVSVELDRKYRFGLSYKPIIVKDWSIPNAESSLIGNGSSTTFFLLSGFLGYSWHYYQSKNKLHELELYPYIGLGSYIGNNYFQGAGSRILFNTGVEQAYLFKQKIGLSFGFEYNYWRYKNDYYVSSFDLQHREQLKFNFLTAEIGLKFIIGLKNEKALDENN